MIGLEKLTDDELHRITKARYGISKRAGHPVDLYSHVLDCLQEWDRRGNHNGGDAACREEDEEDSRRDAGNRK